MQARTGHSRRTYFPWLISLAGVIALLAHLAASSAYSNWSWGFNLYYFLRPGLVAIIIALGCALCLPPVWSRLAGGKPQKAHEKSGLAGKERPARGYGDLAIAAALACLFWFLRMPYHFLGDGRLLVRLLDQGKWFHPTEMLDRLLHYGLLAATRPTLGWDAATAYAALSVAAGFSFVLAALRLGAILRHKFFVTAALVTLGTVELFFGYAESYSLATAAILVYLVLALEYMGGHRRFLWVGVSLVIGVALHAALLFLVPSFAYLMLVKRHGDEAPISQRLIPGAVCLAVTIAIPVAASFGRKSGLLLLPLFDKGAAQYALFSWAHLADFLNEQVLISPLAWLGLVAFGVAFAKDSSLRRSERFRFLVLASALPLAFNLVIRPDLGGSRDWDLWSMGSLAYAVTVVVWIAQGLGKRQEFKTAASTLIVVGLFHVAPWLALNHSPELSLDRSARMLEDNSLWTKERLASASSELAHFYLEADANDEALPLLQRATQLDPKTSRYWDALGVAYIGLRKYKEAEASLTRAIELDPDDSSARNNLGQAYQALGRLGEAEATFKRSIQLRADSATPYFNLGKIYLARGDTTAALDAYGHAVKLMPYAIEYWYSFANLLEAVRGRESEALAAWSQVADLASNDPSKENTRRAALQHIELLRQEGAARNPR